MEKSKYYYDTRFPARVVEDAHNLFLSKLDDKKEIGEPQGLTITNKPEIWELDSRAEFLAECEGSDEFRLDHITHDSRFIVVLTRYFTMVTVQFPDRAAIEDMFNIFERNVDASKIVVEAAPIKIFIGHGRDRQWRDLKDHLHDLHGLDVVAYEIGPRAGRSVKDVLEDMLDESSFAILVLTGEDQHADGELHARQNVVHELGLFQGRLGFTRAVALIEDGVDEFSNILGVNQIRFTTGNIRETFGDVLATVRREFEEQE